jgi:TM2 domain-containing membrane protein YozV
MNTNMNTMNRYHSAGIATVLAIILPGAGQFFNRQSAKGALILLLAILSLVLFAINPREYGAAAWGAMVAWMIGILDAGLVGGRIVRHEHVGPWRWF